MIERWAAFAESPASGNPAGVVLDAHDLTASDMQRIAAEVGYSETAFLMAPPASERLVVRYFAPDGEVDFCGHATIATAVALYRAHGLEEAVIETRAGSVPISAGRDGIRFVGSFLSPAVSSRSLSPDLREKLLGLLGWAESDLDPDFPAALGFGGNLHPVLVARSVDRLAELDYDFDALRALCRAEDWVTVQLVAPVGAGQWHSRNPFPWGGVREDPATGAAAAAFAGYLRDAGRLSDGDAFTIHQGFEMGRPSRIEVRLEQESARIAGPAVPITT
jgi:PhzF family phenazine biosynthesis protein